MERKGDMLSSNFETLPDEVLMIILRYFGSIYTIFRTFSGLNQRLNNILVDRRLHLFTDFLSMHVSDSNVDYYYNSLLFHDMSERLSSLTTTENDKQLRQCLQSLVVFHLNERFKQMEHEFQSLMRQFQSVRRQLTHVEINNLDKELKATFKNLRHYPYPMKYIKRIEFLALNKGARLECDNNGEFLEFNFNRAVSELLLVNIKTGQYPTRRFLNPLIQMFKAVIISNRNLLQNKDQVGGSGSGVQYFLLFSIYRLQCFYSHNSSDSINIHGYQAAVDLLLFIITCLKNVFSERCWELTSFLDASMMITPTDLDPDHKIIIQTSQMEILKIILDEYSRKEAALENECFSNGFRLILQNLIKNERIEVILAIYRHSELVRNFFQNPWNSRKNLDMMTGNRMGRQLFRVLLDENPLGPWFTNTDLLFILLQKRECKYVKTMLKSIPSLIDRRDEDGNTLLLFVCLKVRGCRHCLVKSLIEMGCDLQVRNVNGENFLNVLQLRRNKKLFENLIEQEAIQIDHVCGGITVTSTNRS